MVNDQSSCKRLQVEDLPEGIRDMRYAVRGVVVDRLIELKKQLLEDPDSLPFKKLIHGHIGNPQAVGHKPPTFNREVLSLMMNPELFKNPPPSYPADVIARATRYASATFGVGAYSHSQGYDVFRQEVAQWFEHRDGFPCDINSIWLLDGASSGIRLVLEILIGGKTDGIMIPVPQYPLYSCTITKLGGTAVEYYLNADDEWSLDVQHVRERAEEAKRNGINVRALCIINPGNPTGAVLTSENVEALLRFAEEEGMVVFADEVYQDNIYAEGLEFHSVRRILKQTGCRAQLCSFHSASKGFAGECGLRGGLLQVENFNADVLKYLYKNSSANLCGNIVGQALMALLCNPPKEGDLSFARYLKEKTAILGSLKRKAQMVETALRKIKGYSTQSIRGAMYAFPKVELPQRVIEHTKSKGLSPDAFYCLRLLEETGLATVPGSGFSMPEGRYHFRMTILPKEEDMPDILARLAAFHEKFLLEWGDEEKQQN